MRALPQTILDQADIGSMGFAVLARFDFPEGSFGIFTGEGEFTFGGLVYRGVGDFLGVPTISSKTGNRAEGVTLALADVPTDYLVDDFIAELETYTYDNAPCTITYLAIDPQTDVAIAPLTVERFEIDTVSYQTGGVDDKGRSTATIVVALETVSREITNATFAQSAHAENQADFDATDTAAQHIAMVDSFKVEFGPT